MDNISGSMKSLCEDIATAHEDREKSIKDLKEQVDVIRETTMIFLAENRKLHEEMSKDLKKGLQDKREELVKNVNVLKEDFREKGKEIRADLAEASKIWNKMHETLKAKKRGDKE